MCGGKLLIRKRIFSIVLCVVLLLSMNVTAFAAESQENYIETEKSVTFEVTPTALTAGSSRHSVGMLNSFFGTYDTVATSALGSFTMMRKQSCGAMVRHIQLNCIGKS